MPLRPVCSPPSNTAGKTFRWGLLVLFATTGLTAAGQKGNNKPGAVLGMPDDTAKVLALSDLCFAYRRLDADSARRFGEAALHLARKLRFLRGEAQALNDLAILRIDRSDYTAADSLLRHSLALRTQLHDSAGMAAVHNKLGIIHQARFMLEEALEEDLKALAIYERTGPPSHEATLLNNIAILQFNLQRPQEALATHQRAAAIREQIGDGAGLAASYGNMANVEAKMGDTAAAVGHYERAIGYFRSEGLRAELAVQLNNLAGIRAGQGRLEEAAAAYSEALSIRNAANDRKGIASSLIGLGGTRLRQGRMGEAGHLLHQGLALSRQVDARSEQLQALLDLARLHARQDHGDSSFFFHQAYAALKDSVFNADMAARLAQAETRFETEKKERRIQMQRAEIAELERRSEHRKRWLVTLAGGIAALVLGGLLLLQVQRRKARARHDAAIIREREAGVRGVLEATENERKRMARELHDGIGQQVSGLKFRIREIASKANAGLPVPPATLKEAMALADDVGRDVRDIAHDLMPRSLEELGLAAATGDMLRRTLDSAGINHEMLQLGMEKRLAPEMEVGAYRIAQELVQNTVKHAQAKQVNLQLLRRRDHLVLIYEDDGRGFTATDGDQGIGLRNIRERVHALQGQCTIGNGDLQGMQATVRLPVSTASN